MCTVSVVVPGTAIGSISDGASAPLVRLVCNRDEQRSRMAALPPRRLRLGPREVIMPIDPESGGTWIGANDAGLVACLLNSNPPPGPQVRPGGESRGLIVPRLLACGDVDAAAAVASEIEPARYPPFRLIVLDGERFVRFESDGSRVRTGRPVPLHDAAPIMLTSSGLGDSLVHAPRCDLFESTVRSAAPGGEALAQNTFHDHQWPERPHLSVRMARADARTVSRSTVELRPDVVTLAYLELDADLMPGSELRSDLNLCVTAPEPAV